MLSPVKHDLSILLPSLPVVIVDVYVSPVCSTSGPLQPDGCKLSVLLTFSVNSTPIWRLGNVASMEASIDYTALGI